MDNNGQQHQTMVSHHQRDVHWSMVAVGSTVALVSLVIHYDGSLSDQDRQHKWAVSAISITLASSWMAVLANTLIRNLFVGTLMEGFLILVVCGLSAAVMPVLTDPNTTVSVTSPGGGIKYANLYFFTWFSLIMSFMTLFRFVRELYGTNVVGSFSGWGALALTSIVVAVSSGRLYSYMDCDNDFYDIVPGHDKMCNRTSFGAGIGSVCGFVSVAWMLVDLYWTNKVKHVVEMTLSFTMFASWIFGVGYITFLDDSPATMEGNLYFFTWGSFGLTLFLFIKSVQGYNNSNRVVITTDPAAEDSNIRAVLGDDKKNMNTEDNVMDDGEASA